MSTILAVGVSVIVAALSTTVVAVAAGDDQTLKNDLQDLASWTQRVLRRAWAAGNGRGR